MILLLNYLPHFVFFVGVYIAFRFWSTKKENRIKWVVGAFVVTALVVKAMLAATPNYMPKHTIVRTPIPEIERIEGEIRNIQPQPVSGDERDARRAEQYKQRIQFIKEKE